MESMAKRFRSDNGDGSSMNSRLHYDNNEERGEGFHEGNQHSDQVCRKFNSAGGCPYGSACKYRHVITDVKDASHLEASRGKRNPCMKFFSVTGCSFGDSCHFLHYVPGGLSSLGLSPTIPKSFNASTSAPSASKKRPANRPPADPDIPINGYKTKLCNAFNTPKGCRFADKCHFSHSGTDLQMSGGFAREQTGPGGSVHPGNPRKYLKTDKDIRASNVNTQNSFGAQVHIDSARNHAPMHAWENAGAY